MKRIPILLTCALLFMQLGIFAQDLSCPALAPSPITQTITEGDPVTAFNSNPTGDCPVAPSCFYNSATSNMSINIVGDHTWVSDLKYWEIEGSGPQGTKLAVLYDAGTTPPGNSNPEGSNDFTGSGNDNDNFNVTFDFTAGAVMPSIVGAPFTGQSAPSLTGTHLPESPETVFDGIDISQYSFIVRVYDCTPADTGSITSVNMTITELSCGSDCSGCGGGPGIFNYNLSGAGVIADGACDATSAANVSLAPASAAARTVNWYDAATGGTLLATSETYTPAETAVGSYDYYVEVLCDGASCTPCTSGTCGSSAARTMVTLVISAPVPTLGEWGLIIFALLMLNLAILFILRSKKQAQLALA